jgi:hypothetical protein
VKRAKARVAKARATASAGAAGEPEGKELPASTGLERRREIYVQRRCLGLPQERAAEDAGLTTKQARSFEESALFEQQYRNEIAKADKQFSFSLSEVLKGLKESVDLARTVSEPASMVAGWREIAKIMGYYAPEKKLVHLTADGNITHTTMRQLSDDELLKLAMQGARVIEGEAQRLSG